MHNRIDSVSLYMMAKTMSRPGHLMGGYSSRRGEAHEHLYLKGYTEEKSLS